MEKMSPQPQRSPSTVPLARDAEGNLIEIPEGAIGWRIRRQTGGRPRLVLDSRKQPMLFPLDYTIADVEDVLSPGNYLLDIVDKNGEPLGMMAAVAIGMPRNAESIEPDDDNIEDAPVVVPTSLPSTGSDVRLVLEANVRATQMAFIHNQRTLETGLRMAETLRDTVQVLASSQADWIKSISSARGFFRNAAQPMPPVEVKQLTVNNGNNGEADEGDEEHDEHDEDADGDPDEDGDGGDEGGRGGGRRGDKPHWSEQFMPIITHVITQVLPAVNAWSAKQMADATSRRGAAQGGAIDPRSAEVEAAAQRAQEQEEEQRAARERQERAAQIAAAIAGASSPGPGVDVVKLMQLLPQRTSTKVMQIQMALSPDEQVDAMKILRGYRADGLADLLNVFDEASLEQCKGFLRGLIVEWRGLQAASRARGRTPSPEGGGAGGSGGSGGASGPGGAMGPGGGSGPSGPGSPPSGGGSGGIGGAGAVGGTGGPSSVGVVGSSGGGGPGSLRAARRSSTAGGSAASGAGGTAIVGPDALHRALGSGGSASGETGAGSVSGVGGALPPAGQGGAGRGGSDGTNGQGSTGSP
jgi:hypothetical protein